MKLSDDSIEIVYDKKNKIILDEDKIELNVDNKSYIKMATDGTLSIHGDKYITLNGEDDNAIKWQKFSDMISSYNKHTHAMGSDNGAGGPPLPAGGMGALLSNIFGITTVESLTSSPVQQYNPKQRQRWTLNRSEFDKPPQMIASTQKVASMQTNFGMGYTNSKASKCDKNKLG